MKLSTLAITLFVPSFMLAQTPVTVTTGPGNAQQTYYSLQNGVVSSPALAEWDLAFEVVGISGSIMANNAKGMLVYKAPYTVAEWSTLDTAGLAASWVPQYNNESNWSDGAFNHGHGGGMFDLGWGIYNPVTHNIAGDSCFVIKLADGSWRKFRMDGYAALTDAFTFTWAALDGANELSGSLTRSAFAGKSFGYYSLTNNATVDHEPAANSFDLVFTKYMALVTQPFTAFYPVAGVLQNRTVNASQVDGVPSSSATFSSAVLSTDINVIGYDWKNYNMVSMQWEYAADRTYFVQDQTGGIWKIVFTSYGGGATGDFNFTQELVGQAGIDENGVASTVAVFPNPVTSGSATLVVGNAVGDARMSVFDSNGRAVIDEKLTGLSGLVQKRIDVSSLHAGMYIVRLQDARINTSARLVIE